MLTRLLNDSRHDLVGMDVVEVSPAYDQSDITALAAATIALDLLYLWTQQKKLV
ncbi:arginase family protein [Vibrio rumoiensis]|uniref:Arginase family protein n=1 Tax=Vibrio rumoiensis TaxID=76258 RepID=A0ABW7ITP5_9VIBR